MTGSFLHEPLLSPRVQALYDEDLAGDGYIRSLSRLCHRSGVLNGSDAGLDDGQIFAITSFVAFRLAFSTINDSLGAQPDAQLARSVPQEVREAVTYGRPVAT
jgi:hypothetical protein